jgi:cell division transport system permease protein
MHALREALAAIRRAPVLTALSAAMVALGLFVVGLFAVVSYNLHEALVRVEERVEVVVYLRDDVRTAEVDLARGHLMELEEVQGVRYVSKDEALRTARETLPDLEDIFSGLDANPLPASLEVELHPGFRTPEAVSRVVDLARIYPFVEEVAFGQEWVDRVFLLRRIGAIATLALGAAFAAVAALIIGTAVRIALFARKEEIYIMRLVGAKNGFIRRPFLLEGLFTGVLGGVLAVVMTYASYSAVNRLIFQLEWIPPEWVAAGVAAGGLFGLLAAGLAIRRYLREI